MKSFFLLVSSLLVTHLASGALINFQSASGGSGFQADGSSALTTDYSFQLGTFNTAVLAGSLSTWESGFTNEMVAANTWDTTFPPVGVPRFIGERLMDDGSSAGQQAYIFGKNTAGDEIIIWTNTSWIFPTFDNLDSSADIFSLVDANTEVIQSNGAFTTFSPNNTFTMLSTATAIPEPSTVVLFSLLGAASIFLHRKRRRLCH